MVTSIVLITLIGTLQFNSAISAAINYEPIKITINENFNAQPGQVSPELQEAGVLHQGANFYFKPQLNLSPSHIPSHIEALITLIQQNHHSCAKDTSKVAVEKDKLIEILKPFMYPLLDISKETLSEIVLEKENNLEIIKPIIITEEPKPVTTELLVISEAPILPPSSFNAAIVDEEVKKEESIILEESTGVFPKIIEIAARPITEPIINYGEPKPSTSGLVLIPEAPVLPSLSLNDIHAVEDVKIEESIIVDVEPKLAIQEFVEIPEAPVLPSLSLHDTSSIIEEEVKKEESIILEEPTGVFPTIPEIAVRPIEETIINYVEPKPSTSGLVVIPEAPVLPPLSLNDIHAIEEVKIEEPLIFNFEPKPAIQELGEIPEAPVLPSLSFHDISYIIEEEVKKEESIILEKPTGVFPTIPEIDVRPIEEPILNYVEPKPIISELVVIPEAPVLPPLTLNRFPSVVEEEVKKEESIILEETTGMFPTITEITARPITESIINYGEPKLAISGLVVIPEALVLPSLSLNDIHAVEEVKIEEPLMVNVEPKPAIQELVEIPEAPVLPSLSLHDISSIIEEEVKKEESIILEESTGVFPTITGIAARLITEPLINYGKPKPTTSGLVIIPEAPVLPLLSRSDIHVIEEEVKIEEPIMVDVEPKPAIQELVEIPETPVLPPLSYNGISPVVEDVKIEESIKVEESTGVYLSIPEISARPFPEPLENNKLSETAESFALENNIFPFATEEVKIEIPILLEESIKVFPPIAEISSGPTLQESSRKITDSYVLEEVSQQNTESFVPVKETLPPTIIPKPSNHLGVFSYVPFVSHVSNRAPKTKKLMIPKPASLERFLLKKHPFILPVTPFPKLDLNAIKSSIWGNKKQFLYPTSYAHDVGEKRIAPNMAFKKQNGPKRIKIYIRSNVPKGPSSM